MQHAATIHDDDRNNKEAVRENMMQQQANANNETTSIATQSENNNEQYPEDYVLCSPNFDDIVTLFPNVEQRLTHNKIRNQYFRHTKKPTQKSPLFRKLRVTTHV